MAALSHDRKSLYLRPRLKSRITVAASILRMPTWVLIGEAVEQFLQAKLTKEQQDLLDQVANRPEEEA